MIETQNTEVFTVSQVTNKVSKIFKSNFEFIGVKGEVSNLSISSAGHIYFSLKDSKNILNIASFAAISRNLNFKLSNGLDIVVYGEISCYNSQYQIKAKAIKLSGIGAMMQVLEETKKRLAAEGLFSMERKKKLPYLPKKIALITSINGAVMHDIIIRLRERFPIELYIYDSLMQGEFASQNICKALEFLNQQDDIDIVIIARGGGSIEDLFCFNDENLVRSIAKSRIPVVSAIGHETDYTLCDFVSDMRAPTPTAAAEIVVPSKIEIQNTLHKLIGDINFMISRDLIRSRQLVENASYICNKFIAISREQIYRHRQVLYHNKESCKQCFINRFKGLKNIIILCKRSISIDVHGKIAKGKMQISSISIDKKRILESLRMYVYRMHDGIQYSLRRQFERKRFDYFNYIAAIDSSNHKKILQKGYAVIKDINHKTILADVQDISNCASIAIEMRDGVRNFRIREIMHNSNQIELL